MKTRTAGTGWVEGTSLLTQLGLQKGQILAWTLMPSGTAEAWVPSTVMTGRSTTLLRKRVVGTPVDLGRWKGSSRPSRPRV